MEEKEEMVVRVELGHGWLADQGWRQRGSGGGGGANDILEERGEIVRDRLERGRMKLK